MMRIWRGPRVDEHGHVKPITVLDVIRDVLVAAVLAVAITGLAWVLAHYVGAEVVR